MQIQTEEKKHALCVFGVSLAACRILYPKIEEKEKITAFYSSLAENLLDFFTQAAEAHKSKYEALPRREKRNFAPLRMNMFFAVTHADEEIVSIMREYVLCEGKQVLCYRKSGEVWGVKEEILLPPKKFFKKRPLKIAQKNEFFLEGEEAVLVENFFPEAQGGDGRRARLADYVRETRFERE